MRRSSKNAAKTSGSRIRIIDFCPGAGVWQLPERVYLSLALGVIGDLAAFGLSPLQAANRVL